MDWGRNELDDGKFWTPRQTWSRFLHSLLLAYPRSHCIIINLAQVQHAWPLLTDRQQHREQRKESMASSGECRPRRRAEVRITLARSFVVTVHATAGPSAVLYSCRHANKWMHADRSPGWVPLVSKHRRVLTVRTCTVVGPPVRADIRGQVHMFFFSLSD
jgi:hypothetical protein